MAGPPAADCHFHVFGDLHRYPLAPDIVYQPAPSTMGTVEQLLAVFDAHGITHGLAVGAGPYGTDNRCLLDGIAASGGRLKGIALVRPDVTDAELDRLGAGGIVGVRINLLDHGIAPLRAPGMDRLLARLKERGWFAQVHCGRDQFADAAPVLRAAGVRVLVDHFARPEIARGLDQPGFRALLDFGRSGQGVLKISGPFRAFSSRFPWREADPFMAAAIEAFGIDRCVWGSDWPFTRVDERVDYGPVLGMLARWVSDERDRRKVLWDNPSRLFGFA